MQRYLHSPNELNTTERIFEILNSCYGRWLSSLLFSLSNEFLFLQKHVFTNDTEISPLLVPIPTRQGKFTIFRSPADPFALVLQTNSMSS